MENKILELSEQKYVLATIIDGAPMYLKKKLQKTEYIFVKDIRDATKTNSVEAAKIIKSYYRHDTGRYGVDLAIIPLVIDYSLIKEI